MFQALYEDEGKHPDIARSLRSVGAAYGKLGNAAKARQYYQQALQMQQALHEGENHDDVAQAFYTVELAYGCLGRLEEAIQHYEQALAVPAVSQEMKAVIGHDLGIMYHIAALAARQASDEQQAQAYLGKATASFEQPVQASEAVKAGLYTAYGNFLLATGKTSQAYSYLHQSIASGDDVSGLG